MPVKVSIPLATNLRLEAKRIIISRVLTAVLNLVMSIPIKVETGTRGVLLALGNAAAIWPYINVGALIGIIAAPWMLGQVIGGLIGASLLTSLKASAVRALLVIILFASSLKLVARGIETLTGIEIPVL